MANFFDPAIPAPQPWGTDPPPVGPEGDYSPRPKSDPAAKDAPPALWGSSGGWAEAEIPKRPWIVRGYIMRGSVSILAGPGSAGKSSVVKGWMLAATFGFPYGRFRPAECMRVMSYNTEDDLDEERRRISATCRQFNLTSDELPETLRIIGPEQVGTLITRDPVSGYCIPTTAMEQLEAMLDEFRPDILFLDPLVELHNAEENDNTGLRAVVAYFRSLAHRYRMGVVILHHTRKGATTPGDPDAVRGASSVVGAARVVLTVCPMTEDEALKIGIDPRRRRLYFRVDPAKQNYAPIDDAEWFQRVPYLLDNDEEVAAAEPWTPPSPWDGLTWAVIDDIMDAIERGPAGGELYTQAKQSKRWAGRVIMDLGLRSEAQSGMILRAWIESGLLVQSSYESPSLGGKSAACLRVDETKLSEMRQHAPGAGE